jgi:exodeoxyribonuclease VII small subunit
MASFEEQLTALEKVVERLERGELSLDESVRLFEEGMRLSEACKVQLESAEGKIQVLLDGAKGAMKVRDLEVEVDIDEDEDEG